MRPRSLNVFRSRCLIVLLAAFPATIGHASGSGLLPRTAATSKAEFCAQARDDNYFRELGMEHRNHIGFVNPLGPLLVGECWWHARLQRSALYLAVFRPELPKPDRKEARAIIDRLARNEEVVEIPGFSDFQQFAHEHEGKLRNYLARWELRDIFRNKYYKKANRPWKMSADDFKFAMDELHESVALRHRVTLLTLRYRGPLWTIHGVLCSTCRKRTPATAGISSTAMSRLRCTIRTTTTDRLTSKRAAAQAFLTYR